MYEDVFAMNVDFILVAEYLSSGLGREVYKPCMSDMQYPARTMQMISDI
jgi:hypothetical protein